VQGSAKQQSVESTFFKDSIWICCFVPIISNRTRVFTQTEGCTFLCRTSRNRQPTSPRVGRIPSRYDASDVCRCSPGLERVQTVVDIPPAYPSTISQSRSSLELRNSQISLLEFSRPHFDNLFFLSRDASAAASELSLSFSFESPSEARVKSIGSLPVYSRRDFRSSQYPQSPNQKLQGTPNRPAARQTAHDVVLGVPRRA